MKAFAMRICHKAIFLAVAMLSSHYTLADDTPVNAASQEPVVNVSDHLRNARAWIEAKNWPKALVELKQAARDEPSNADVHNLLGYSYRKQTEPDLNKAFEHYNEALKLNPRHLGAHEYIGEAYLMAKKPAEAQKHLLQLQVLCGHQTCEEYVDLANALALYKAANP